MVGHDPPIHDVLSLNKLTIPLVETLLGGIMSLDYLFQGIGQLCPTFFGLLPQVFDGLVDLHKVVELHINVDDLVATLYF